MADCPSVSVVVPTYNRLDRLKRVLAALAEQDYCGEMEIVVVSDGSDDGTSEYLGGPEAPAAVVPVLQENAGPAAARNAGVAACCGKILVFVDDDVVASPGLISAHVEAHRRNGDHAAVIGPMLDPPDHVMTPWIVWEQRMLAKQYRDMEQGHYAPTERQFYTGNASLCRTLFVASGGFDTQFRRAEDVELAFRLKEMGTRFAYEPRAVGFHYAERSYNAWKANAYDYGRNDVVFGRDLGRTWLLPFLTQKQQQRNLLVRAVTNACAGRPPLARAVNSSLEKLLGATSAKGLPAVLSAVLSLIYGIEYYRGVLDEAGGVGELRRLTELASANGEIE